MIKHLDGSWTMRRTYGGESFEVKIPASVYGTLTENGRIPDPYFGENQYAAFQISDDNYTFEHVFAVEDDFKDCDKYYLRFEGIDTNAIIYINGKPIGKTENMHRTYEFDVTENILAGQNKLQVCIYSPIEYVKSRQSEDRLWGVASTTDGFSHIRKAHYMYGWDWGPSLPDMGIWREAQLVGVKGGRIESVYARQRHTAGSVSLTFETKIEDVSSDGLRLDITVAAPDGKETAVSVPVKADKLSPEITIDRPMLWNVRGFGKQNLYRVAAVLFDGSEPVDAQKFSVGLRTVEVSRSPDKDGEEFCFAVNGMRIFAMGANYIPEDQILPRRSEERTKALLESCAAANYNMIRVWGGGFYPDDYFYEACDRLGLLVWQDLAFACAVYNADVDFCNNVKQEAADNVKRLRNHPSLAMWCGNNEIESAILYWGIPVTDSQKQSYTRIFEKLIPNVIKHYDPQTFYWPSSPSSGGNFADPSAENRGDSHYWAVWHGLKPFDDLKNHKFRFCSEYGFESIPCMKTVRSFAEKKDMNLMSPVMEAHQKCEAGNEKLLYYLAQTVHYPYSFEGLVYASQLVQADAVRINAEHMRRNRGVCMGSLYWQINDSNPVISWSSIDYFGRWKALHYYARKFYAPVLCSIDDSDRENPVINISNETPNDFMGRVRWRVRRNDTKVIAEGVVNADIPPLTSKNILTLNAGLTKLTADMRRNHYIEYSLIENNAVISDGACMLEPLKRFEFLDPKIGVEVDLMGDLYRFAIDSVNFAKGVYLDFDEFDCPFKDNWFDLHGQTYSLLVNRAKLPQDITPQDLEEKIRVRSYYDLLKGE